MNANKRGFTLIELLVVISIIALLVSILLPALNQARILAKQTVCAAHVRGMGTALHLYANDYKDTPPPCQASLSNPYIWCANYVFEEFREDGSGWPKPVNLALLHEAGTIDNPRVYFCPGQTKATAQILRGMLGEWFFTNGTGWGEFDYPSSETHLRGDFTYWLHSNNCTTKLSKVSDKPIIFDLVTNAVEVAHCSGDFQPRGHNTFFGDGHVEFRTGNEMYYELLWNIKEWNGIHQGGGMAGFPKRFLEFVRRLEGLPPEPDSVWYP